MLAQMTPEQCGQWIIDEAGRREPGASVRAPAACAHVTIPAPYTYTPEADRWLVKGVDGGVVAIVARPVEPASAAVTQASPTRERPSSVASAPRRHLSPFPPTRTYLVGHMRVIERVEE